MPDGQEAKASPSLSVSGLATEAGVEVQQLRTCLQEAHYRETAIQTKLQALAAIIQATQVRLCLHHWEAAMQALAANIQATLVWLCVHYWKADMQTKLLVLAAIIQATQVRLHALHGCGNTNQAGGPGGHSTGHTGEAVWALQGAGNTDQAEGLGSHHTDHTGEAVRTTGRQQYRPCLMPW